MNEVTQTLEVAKGISDYGFGTIASGAFVVLGIAMFVMLFMWFKNILSKLVSDNVEKMEELLEETKKQNIMLLAIRDGLLDETMLQIKNTSSMAFNLSAYEVLEVIKTVRRENNIINRENTTHKIHKLVGNLYRDIKSKLDCYPYKGRHLSDFMRDDWVDKVSSVVESEVYHDKGENAAREHTNVFAAFDEIKIEFYNRIK